MQAFRFDTRSISTDDPRFAQRVAEAHARKERPLCLCLPNGDGLPMYVSRLGDHYLVKRMPNTGSRHHPDCDSYEPPPELSGLGELAGAAIHEDIEAGLTTLKLDFSLTKVVSRAAPIGGGAASDTVRTDGSRLTLRGALHYLWDQAQLNRWTPGMAGKRSWYVVRKHLLLAAADKAAKGSALTDTLFIPEQFSVERKEEILERRIAKLNRLATQGASRKLMLLIGEVKTIEPARYGHRITVKHLPDFPLALPADLHQRMLDRFHKELSLWSADETTHLVVVATFGINAAGVASIEELCVVVTTANWIPVEHLPDAQLVDELTWARRRFTKGLRYNLSGDRPLASAVLSDTAPAPVALYVVPPDATDTYREALNALTEASDLVSWIWKPGEESMPALPPARGD